MWRHCLIAATLFTRYAHAGGFRSAEFTDLQFTDPKLSTTHGRDNAVLTSTNAGESTSVDRAEPDTNLDTLPEWALERIGGQMDRIGDRLTMLGTVKSLHRSRASKLVAECVAKFFPRPGPGEVAHGPVCPLEIDDAMLYGPESLIYFNEADVGVLDLFFSPHRNRPLTTMCLELMVEEFKRADDSLFARFHTLRIGWDDQVDGDPLRPPFTRLPGQVEHFRSLWAVVQSFLNKPFTHEHSPPSPIKTLSIQSNLLDGVSMGRFERLVLDFGHWSHSDDVVPIVRAAAGQLYSLALVGFEVLGFDVGEAVGTVLDAVRDSSLEGLEISSSASFPARAFLQYPFLSLLESLPRLKHLKIAGIESDTHFLDEPDLWSQIICHSGLVSFDVDWSDMFGDDDLTHLASCIAANPGLKRLVLPNVRVVTHGPGLTMYFDDVANHRALREWSVPHSMVFGEDSMVEYLWPLRFPNIRTLWWPILKEWPSGAFPHVRKMVVPDLPLSVWLSTGLPTALDELVIVDPTLFAPYEIGRALRRRPAGAPASRFKKLTVRTARIRRQRVLTGDLALSELIRFDSAEGPSQSSTPCSAVQLLRKVLQIAKCRGIDADSVNGIPIEALHAVAAHWSSLDSGNDIPAPNPTREPSTWMAWMLRCFGHQHHG